MYSRVAACLLFVTTLGSPGLGVEISPPNPVPQYSLIRVKTSPGSDVWVLSFVGGQVTPVDMEYASDGLVVFTGAPGSFAVLGKENGKQFTRVVTIEGQPAPPIPPPTPPTPPPPGPGPTPTPTRPGQIAKMVTDYAPPDLRNLCLPLSDSYRAVAARIGVDLFTPEQIRDASRSAAGTVLQGKIPQWTPFYNQLSNYLFAWASEAPRSREDYRAMWLDISAGLALISRKPLCDTPACQ